MTASLRPHNAKVLVLAHKAHGRFQARRHLDTQSGSFRQFAGCGEQRHMGPEAFKSLNTAYSGFVSKQMSAAKAS